MKEFGSPFIKKKSNPLINNQWQSLNLNVTKTMKNINAQELLELTTIQQSFDQLVSAMQATQFLEGLTDIAWLMATNSGDFTKNAPNALFPIMYFFIALSEAERKIWKDRYHELNKNNGIPRESIETSASRPQTVAEGTPQATENE
jgi:hypothetical protein